MTDTHQTLVNAVSLLGQHAMSIHQVTVSSICNQDKYEASQAFSYMVERLLPDGYWSMSAS